MNSGTTWSPFDLGRSEDHDAGKGKKEANVDIEIDGKGWEDLNIDNLNKTT